MSTEPSSGRPTGPPSGPLSGGPSGSGPSPPGPPPVPPPGPPAGPPSGPPSGVGGTGQDGGRGAGRPWWRSVPRIATVAVALVAAVVLAIVLTRPDNGGPGTNGEVFLQAASTAGPDPYTESSAREAAPSVPPPTTATTTPSETNVMRSVAGSEPGLYGGTRDAASCDVEKQITLLTADPAKNSAFASVLNIRPSDVPAHLRSLTPVQLRMDTRVTNHGYKDGAPTSYQAVLQAGTAVLVDDRGVPRVRCACGNPLLPPVALKGTPRRTGRPWPAFQPSNVVVVAPSAQVVNVFIVFDPENEDWFAREKGADGREDKKVPPPVRPSPETSVPGTASPSGPTSLPPEPPPGESSEHPPASEPPPPDSPPDSPDSPDSPPDSPDSPDSPPDSPDSPPDSPDSPPDSPSPGSPLDSPVSPAT
ncbi:hypothetical protein NLX86_21735 [Streptomyces sp. A3M-1-3]|uniref:DUF6777 domain-containing protein n=1 Tax=Streptomyces sp. A3M-1-3 TaxID=2962044 RepID=UPI0020B7E68A|nr:DUF6777 domain-containing protein [Streptomyces sp. A3M-1-3]MCP3820621.1 hypothetical protein [Streptomyces sp. A3M-1-3]